MKDDQPSPVSHYETPVGFREHPLRSLIDNEIHARPFEELRAPMQASHLAFLTGRGSEAVERDRAHIKQLCERYDLAPPSETILHLSVDCGPFRLKWERHSEFSTYTFFLHGPYPTPFAEVAISQVPQDWLEGIAGALLVATHIVLESIAARPREMHELQLLFGTNNIAGSRITGGAAEAWSDFRIRDDGFGRILVKDRGLHERQAGRVVQRFLDIETYRTMAMLASPLARRIGGEITAMETRLADLTAQMIRREGLEQEHALLAELSDLAAKVERSAVATTYRFGAARAYYTLVERRIEDIREERIEGVQTIEEFMDRRLAPAMDTVASVWKRQQQLSERVSRAANLLRTRVDVALQDQNGALLQSMNHRAHLQLRLQETVEGLSVVVLSYYLVGLVSYAVKALYTAGLPLNVDLAVGIAIPIVVGSVWLGIRALRRKLAGEHHFDQ